MKITSQSIEWIGDGEVRVSTTRSKGGRGFGFMRIGPFGVGSRSRQKKGTTTEIIEMDRERYEYERDRIQSGKFRDYDPEKVYRYEDTPKAKWEARVQQWRDRRQRKKREQQAAMDKWDVAAKPPRTIWQVGVIIGTLFWALLFLVAGSLESGTILDSVMAFGMFTALVVMPVSIYKDIAVASRSAPNWFPRRWAYVIGGIVPLVSGVVGAIYLYRRRKYGSEVDFEAIEPAAE